MAWHRLVVLGGAASLLFGCAGDDAPVEDDGTSTGGDSTTAVTTVDMSTSTTTDDVDSSSGGSTTAEEADSSSGVVEEFCGDGIVDDDSEQCDEGENNSETGSCKPDCTLPFCGDGFTQEGVEECDDANDVNTDGCTDMCIILESCGDGEIQDPEECDNGRANADNAECKTDCMLNVCGDGDILAGQEECDDGNDNDNDACTTLCAPPTCGDGFVQSVVAELCDDGDLVDGDECNSDCFTAGLWTVTQNGPANNNDGAYGVAIDSLNNVIAVGELFDPVEGYNIWVRSYDGNGQENWTDTYHSGVTSDNAFDVLVAPNDDIWVVGSSFSLSDGRDIWLRQYSPDGTPGPITTANGDDNNADEAFSVAMDSNGDLLVAGYVTTVANGQDIWLRKYTTAGSIVWTRIVTSAGDFLDQGHGVAVDSNDNVIITGFIWGGAEARDIWVRKYDTNGNEDWTDIIPGAGQTQDEGNGVATDSMGNVIVTGFINDGDNARDVWVRKYDPDGDEMWTETYNGPQNGSDVGEDVAVDTDDNIIVVGSHFRGSQQDNVWVRKFDPDGNELWTMEYNNSDANPFQSEAAQGVAVDSEDNLAIVGFETRSDIGEARNIWVRYMLQ